MRIHIHIDIVILMCVCVYTQRFATTRPKTFLGRDSLAYYSIQTTTDVTDVMLCTVYYFQSAQ